jgi:hypothetical protein
MISEVQQQRMVKCLEVKAIKALMIQGKSIRMAGETAMKTRMKIRSAAMLLHGVKDRKVTAVEAGDPEVTMIVVMIEEEAGAEAAM